MVYEIHAIALHIATLFLYILSRVYPLFFDIPKAHINYLGSESVSSFVIYQLQL